MRGFGHSVVMLAFAIAISGCGATDFAGSGGAKAGAKQSNNAKRPTKKDKSEADSRKSEDADNDSDTPDDEISEEDSIALKNLPKFAMLANKFECGFCHLAIIGDMVSTSTVKQTEREAIGSVVGDWLVNGTLDIQSDGNIIEITGEVKENYTGDKMPKGVPVIDFAKAKSAAKGRLKTTSVTIDKQFDGNLLIEGTDSDPIEIKGDVHVTGDVIITGSYKGIGTIYASGNIFVPFDLIAQRSVFPFPDDRDDALAKARASVSSGSDDGLGLATPGTIYIGDVDSGVIGILAPIDTRSEVNAMYDWFGRDKFSELYGDAYDCRTAKKTRHKAVNVVDAFLYANRSIEGKADSSALSIRGGMITDYFNVLSAANGCEGTSVKSPVHGRAMDKFYVEYDWRFQTGKFRVLERLGQSLSKED